MNIHISVKEYFNELRLMKKQFGQEEDLYPWIYMLLQMAECKKRKALGENYQPVSMRFVASASKADSVQGRKQISAYGTFPDIAIFSKDFNASEQIKANKDKILGCVEAKKISDKLISINGDFNLCIEKVEEILELRPSPGANYRYYRKVEKNKTSNQEWVLSNTGNVKKPVTVNEISNPTISILQGPRHLMYIWNKENNINKQCFPISEENSVFVELISELLWYGKVIYTNGLHWKLLTLSRIEKRTNCTETKISEFRKEFFDQKDNKEWYEWLLDYKFCFCVRIETLADLSSCYKDYKKGPKNYNFESKKIKEEWANLIEDLANINWYE